jgi:hypothetical protein
MCPIISIPNVAARLDLEVDGVGVVLLGIEEVAEKSSAFLRLVVWRSETSSIRGLRWGGMYGVLSIMRTDL